METGPYKDASITRTVLLGLVSKLDFNTYHCYSPADYNFTPSLVALASPSVRSKWLLANEITGFVIDQGVIKIIASFYFILSA